MNKNISIALLVLIVILGVSAYFFLPISGNGSKAVNTSEQMKDAVVINEGFEEYTTISGISFQKPQDWTNAVTDKSNDTEKVTFVSPDFKASPQQTGIESIGNYLSTVSSGNELTITVSNNPRIADALKDSQAYVDFYNTKCGNCKVQEIKKVDNVPANFKVVQASDFGGHAEYALYYNGKVYNLKFTFSDNYEKHSKLFDEIVSSVKLK